MIREILLVHHSHTDIGYTHPQPVIFELHRRFIDQALVCCEADPDFRWTCEVTGITLDWWKTASPASHDRFHAAARRGQIEVAGMMWNLTPLFDHSLLLRSLEPIAFFRALGIEVRSAMNSDVNGVPWGLVDALLDHGIEGFSMGVNEHYGYAVQPRPGAFWWESPTGRRLLVWNGLQYWNAANIHMRIPSSVDSVAEAMPPFLRVWEDRGYPLSFLPVQVTTASAPDNAAPDPKIPAFVREWNATDPEVTLRLVNLSEVFDRLRREDLPTMRGDWTDWWNFGCGSTARETALALDGMRLLECATALPPADGSRAKNAAADSLQLYAEHTWGADRSVHQPDSIETYSQLNQKLGYAYRGYDLARAAARDGMVELAKTTAGEELTALIYNPAPVPIRRTLKVPTEATGIDYLAEPRLHLAHRQDVVLADLPDPSEDSDQSTWVGPIDLPAFGYVAIPYRSLPATRLAKRDGIGNDRLDVRFDGRPGVASLSLDGQEYVGDSTWRFAQPVLETPVGGRGGIFGPLNWRDLNVHDQWHIDWQAERQPPRLIGQETRSGEHLQSLEMPNGDRIDLLFRVYPEEPNLEVVLTLRKQQNSAPNSLYLPFPLAADPSKARCHFETAGAIVELDREQLPYASRHYLTTMRFIRLQDENKGLTIACPHAPLWQVGGFTFGRIGSGEVRRPEAMLNAWLTNNYWDVNFCADEAGTMRFRFRIIPHRAEPIHDSIRQAVAYAYEPQLHFYKNLGPIGKSEGRLLRVEGDSVVTGLRREDNGASLFLLNPADEPARMAFAADLVEFDRAYVTDLGGKDLEPLAVSDARCEYTVPPKAWKGIRLVKSE